MLFPCYNEAKCWRHVNASHVATTLTAALQIVQWPGKGNEWEEMEEEEENERKEKESLLINSLAMDPSLRFVMALTNKNSVCIWRHPPQA